MMHPNFAENWKSFSEEREDKVMLLSLDIKNAALIENLSLETDRGMTVLTGETGAGKSVIINALNLICGARINKNIVRYGEKKAVIQAVIETDDLSEIQKNGIETEENTVIVTREISADGRSVCRINGVIVPQNIVREIMQKLINIHGQHDSRELLTRSRHINLLDIYAENEKLLSDYEKLYDKKKELEQALEAGEMDEAERLRRTDLLTYQIEELESADLKIGEKEELSSECSIMRHSAKISEFFGNAYELIYDGENSAYDKISTASGMIAKISDIDLAFDEILKRVSEIEYNIEDTAHEIYEKMSAVEYDEQRLNDTEERLDLINRMERKYGGSVEAALDYLEKSKSELEKTENIAEHTAKIEKELENVNNEIQKAADRLSASRKKSGKKLSEDIKRELAELDMPGVKFSVEVENCDYTKNGADSVDFMISPNPGEPLKPLEKIASGGELSRIMLAVKTIFADTDDVDTLIFDEIDTGVSGSAAEKIAQKLFRLSEKKQIICVSHLPQLAAAADNHYLVKKTGKSGRTVTTATLISGEERAAEVARITDGENITDASVEHAKQMLARYTRG